MRIVGRASLVVLLLAMTIVLPDASVYGQGTTVTNTPPAPTPDAKAFTDANKITEPDKKIAAMEKLLADFPDTTRKSQVYDTVFTTLVKSFPENRTKIVEYAQKVIDAAPENMKSSGYSRVASRLVDAGILLDDAATFTEKGLEVFEAEEKKRTERSRATHLATLGRIRVKQGRTADAEKALKAAFDANPEIPSAVIGLAELSETRKDSKGALEYWTKAALTGRLTADDRKRFETTYVAVHGSTAGLEELLDAKYKAANPPPVHPVAYKPTAARSSRLVLGEVFTGASCPPCVSVDLAFDAAMERYTRKDLAVLMYHLHIPGPDPMTNKSTEARAKFYGVTGVPQVTVDGAVALRGGGDRAATKGTYERLVTELDKAVEVAPDGDLRLDVLDMSAGVLRVKATPSNLKSEGGPVVLHIALVEELLTYSGENGVRFHPMVVRSLAGENAAGMKVDRAAPTAAEWQFDVAKISADLRAYLDDYEQNGPRGKITFTRKPSTLDTGKLSVVAFLQDEKSKKVLQSAYVKVGGAKTSSAASR